MKSTSKLTNIYKYINKKNKKKEEEEERENPIMILSQRGKDAGKKLLGKPYITERHHEEEHEPDMTVGHVCVKEFNKRRS
jgi:hypothetical protein